MIRFSCPSCGKRLKAPENGTGRKTSCPGCGQSLYVPPPLQRTGRQAVPDGTPDGAQAGTEKAPVAIQNCPRCEAHLSAPPELLDHWFVCPRCGEGFVAASTVTPLPDRTQSAYAFSWEQGPVEDPGNPIFPVE